MITFLSLGSYPLCKWRPSIIQLKPFPRQLEDPSSGLAGPPLIHYITVEPKGSLWNNNLELQFNASQLSARQTAADVHDVGDAEAATPVMMCSLINMVTAAGGIFCGGHDKYSK